MRGREYPSFPASIIVPAQEKSITNLLVVNRSTVSNGFGLRHASFPSAALLNPEALSDRTKLNLGLKSAGSLSIPPGLGNVVSLRHVFPVEGGGVGLVLLELMPTAVQM